MDVLSSLTLLILVTFANAETSVTTTGEFENVYFPLNGGNIVKFKVKAGSDATVTFVGQPSLDINKDPYLEVVLGGSKNQVSFIRRQRYGHGITDVPTPGILSDSEFRGFWIKLIPPGTVMVGKQTERVPLSVWTDPNPFNINHYGVGTCCGATGEWKIEEGSGRKDVSICAPDEVVSSQNPLTQEPVHMVKDTCFQLLTDVYSCNANLNNNNRIRGNKTFVISEDMKNWDEAKAECEKNGQRLASIRNKEEQAQLEKALISSTRPITGVWLAANDRAQYDQFYWHDGSSDPVSFSNWGSSSPPPHQATGKNCVFASYVALVIKQNALWFIQRCSDVCNFVCES